MCLCPGTSCHPSWRRATPGQGHCVPCLPTQPWLGCHRCSSLITATAILISTAHPNPLSRRKASHKGSPLPGSPFHLPPRGPLSAIPPFTSTCGLTISLASCAFPTGPHLCQPLVCSAPHLRAQRAACRKSVGAMAEQSEPAPDTAGSSRQPFFKSLTPKQCL